MNPQTHKLVVFVKDGLYVMDWQYSQGHFDVTTTPNLLFAKNFGMQPDRLDYFYDTFFRKRGWTIEEWDVTATRTKP